jgi:hypothetical protein
LVAGQGAALVVEVVPCTLYRMIHGICALCSWGTHGSMALVLLVVRRSTWEMSVERAWDMALALKATMA